MKLTNKQKDEIDFLFILSILKGDEIKFTDDEIEEYISCSVHGKHKNAGKFSNNRLFQRKRNLDIMIKAWKVGLKEKIIIKEELIKDFKNNYITKIIKQL